MSYRPFNIIEILYHIKLKFTYVQVYDQQQINSDKKPENIRIGESILIFVRTTIKSSNDQASINHLNFKVKVD
ncbi:hypothetical protein BCT01_08385 [Vibrio tasmaniensis]|nr:hypothetical protein BCT01_08385 [Vibrio tasmaniensis]